MAETLTVKLLYVVRRSLAWRQLDVSEASAAYPRFIYWHCTFHETQKLMVTV